MNKQLFSHPRFALRDTDTIPFVHYEALSCQIRAHIIVKNMANKGAVLVNMRHLDQHRRERLAQLKSDMMVDDLARRANQSRGLSMLLAPQAD